MNAQNLSIVPGNLPASRVLLPRKPELWIFVAFVALVNAPLLPRSFSDSLILLPEAVRSGEWWRVFTHPFVHVTWYHLLLDGAAFLSLYSGLAEPSMWRRLGFVSAAGAGSALISCLAAPAVSTNGLCGLSGIAHGLMAVSALEMIGNNHSQTRRLGWWCFALVIGKAAIEALSGRMFFTFLHFGLMGEPIAVSHAGGIIGALAATVFHSRKNHGGRTSFETVRQN
jgi:rhomboid family GlyGly-CTERM serine protease